MNGQEVYGKMKNKRKIRICFSAGKSCRKRKSTKAHRRDTVCFSIFTGGNAMIKSKFKRVTSLFLATLMCVTTFAGIGSTTAYAASGEKADVYMVDFPRDGDANYDGVWGHSNLTLKNGWHTGRSNFTNLKAIGSYSGNVAYCIEPGISLKVGQTMNKYDENYFNNLAANGVISGDEIRLFVGRILQYGYRGTISTSWRSQNEAAAKAIDADLSGPEEEREADDRMESAAIVAEDKGAYQADREGRTR